LPKYIVKVPEIWMQDVEVEAESADDAIQRVADGEGNYLDDTHDYSHTVQDLGAWDAIEA
jgi:hypothetical protein